MSEMQGKIRKNLGIGFIIASLFFLFNPDIAIIDFLPDVFGYLLMIFGISQLSEINEKIYEAKRYFIKAAVCNTVKLALIVVLFGMVTPREMPVSMLLFTFVMNFFDLIYVIPAYLNLFGGLMYLGERLDGDFVLARKRYAPRKCPLDADEKRRAMFDLREKRRRARYERKLSNTEKIQRATIFFVVFKSVTPVLPEFTSLLDYEYNDSLINYYDFIYLFRTVAIILMFIVGIVWLVRAVRYFSRLIKDKVFISSLAEKYTIEVLPNKVLFMKKFINRATIIFACASFLLVNAYFDEVNIIPGVISAIIFMIGSFYVRKYTEKWKFCFISSVVMTVSSLLLEISRANFNKDFIREQILRNPAAYGAWEDMFIVSVAAGVGALLTVISVLVMAGDIAVKYTGFFTPGSDSFDPRRATKELHSELCRPLILTGIFGGLAALCIPFYVYGMLIRFQAVWFLDLVFSLLFAVSFSRNISYIVKNVNLKHFLGDE